MEALLQLKGIDKAFPGVKALSGAALNVYPGRVMALVAQLAEIETSVYRLAVQIRKTHRRVNALEKVVIPQDKAEISFISDVLEEGEREDFTRMKLAQKKIKE